MMDTALSPAGAMRRTQLNRNARMNAALGTHPLFAPCEPDVRHVLLDQARLKQFKRGDMVFHRGHAAQHVYCILQGSVQVMALDADGRERVIELFGADDVFGEIHLLLDARHRHWAQANIHTRLLQIPRAAFLEALNSDPDLAYRTMLEVSRRAERLIDRICTTATPRGISRVITYLANLAEDAREDQTVALPAAKRTVASLLNLTHESFSRLLRQLSERGLIRVQGRSVHIPDLQRLLAADAMR